MCCITYTADIFWSLKNFRISEYLSNIWNIVDWTHFIFMWVAWASWLGNIRESNSFIIEPSYRILASPATETRARFFEIDPEQETKFMSFSTKLRNHTQNMGNYVNLTTICGEFRKDGDIMLDCNDAYFVTACTESTSEIALKSSGENSRIKTTRT